MIITALIVGGIVVGSILLAGCEDDDHGDPDLAGVPFKGDVATEPEPEPEAFVKGQEYKRVDDRSFELYNYVWENPANAHLGVWRPRERMYIGAAAELLRPIHEERLARAKDTPDAGAALDPVVKQYSEAVTESFFSYYRNRPGAENLPLEQSILVLIGGLAPTKKVDVAIIEGALDALGKRSPGNDEFIKVLKAGAHFNLAADMVVSDEARYSDPKAAAGMTEDQKAGPRKMLDEKVLHILYNVDRDALDDRQIEFLFALEGAARGLKESLGPEDEPEVDQGSKKQTKKIKKGGGKKKGGGEKKEDVTIKEGGEKPITKPQNEQGAIDWS